MLFESTQSLLTIATELQSSADFSCQDIIDFTGLHCFKHGAAFDKMGYYSIFMNVFLSLHYWGLVNNVDDSISLCIYFRFMCNGTSILAAVWKQLWRKRNAALVTYKKRPRPSILFDILVFINREVILLRDGETSTFLLGNCKLPRYQYANYTDDIVKNCSTIHYSFYGKRIHKALLQRRLPYDAKSTAPAPVRQTEKY